MAIGAIVRVGGDTRGQKPTVSGSLRSQWHVCNDSLETADTSELLTPHAITRAAFHWVKVPEGALGIIPRARNDAAATTVTTSPVVRLMGAYGEPNSDGAFSTTRGDANFAEFVRLDNADANAAGITLSLAASGNLEDAAHEYGDLVNLTGYSLLSCWYVGMLVETAANVTGGALNTVQGTILFI